MTVKEEDIFIPTLTSTFFNPFSLPSPQQSPLPPLFYPLPTINSSSSQDVVVEGDLVVVCSGGEEVVVPSLLLTSSSPWLATLLEEVGTTSLSLPSISSSTFTTLLTSFYSNTPTEGGLEAIQTIQALGTENQERLLVKEDVQKDIVDTKHEESEEEPLVMKEDGPSETVAEESEEGEIKKKTKKARKNRHKSEKILKRLNKQKEQTTSFLCPDCGEDFTKLGQPVVEFQKHMKHAHRDTESYRPGVRKYNYICPDCGKDYRNAGAERRKRSGGSGGRAQKYEKHLWRCKVDRFSCECPGVPVIKPKKQKVYSKDEDQGNFYDYQRKWQHMQVVHSKKHGCMETIKCAKTFDSTEDLQKHIELMHGDDECGRLQHFDCGDCGKQLNKLTVPNHHDLKRQIENHKRMHRVLNFFCDCPELTLVKPGQEFGIRGFIFSAIFRENEKHMLVAHEGWFGCKAKHCLRSFKTAVELSGHMKHHRKYVCDLCGFEATYARLGYHKKEVHEKTSFPCEDCGQQFVTKGKLDTHKRKVHVEKVACEICGAIVKDRTRHMDTVHTADAEKKFQCEDCNKGFQSKILLRIHEESVHTESPQYQCQYGCENQYRNLSNRSAHERKRHGQIWKKQDFTKMVS